MENEKLSTFQKIKIYLLSIFLTPLGVYWFIKYFRSPNRDKRLVGYLSLVITLATLVVTIAITSSYLNVLNDYVGNYNLDIFTNYNL
ncbi:hypothetical protein A3F07_04720 [candidate division WWE3 bacterium RIFCSPHIGHO2_12_FULL_38_15]|uniref:DUF5671 domain-containing protein n=1 Tax=candidate division WWE3 bacterium RIFCSPHIGHO2_02_FULL_38_14 TaxID=1802620 RepID=A0A1F4V8P3_UNCKA|nr:MAG: hypothetical protein A2793_00350 [candidate division WWE3 bacterium RIFCSPHIGHO2_01_FULL_38_45]OGC49544.1 MAG: hypothetical protein A3F07_04720 [candidate division WWE3 bacterium RIFCSPHIGHO2_12_FULL_38_15]OGC52470.1 MAG: hypothetical protein A3B64_02660 [candidate division WWE3 bacterium RIFCSPLOWO2_01_FULL_37_24]OGC53300.1 MAG: hypothetical protein A3D91_02715 [candidate division WWE3 bacterium RIFCSPHIGHO2_02_FULL_38_14]HLB51809.1 hypothetical protein [Patescibacteria group bacterium